METTEANKLTKKLKGKLGTKNVNRGFEKLWHIPENLESHTYVEDYAHA